MADEPTWPVGGAHGTRAPMLRVCGDWLHALRAAAPELQGGVTIYWPEWDVDHWTLKLVVGAVPERSRSVLVMTYPDGKAMVQYLAVGERTSTMTLGAAWAVADALEGVRAAYQTLQEVAMPTIATFLHGNTAAVP